MRRFVEGMLTSALVLSAISYAELHSVIARLQRTRQLSEEDAVGVRASVETAWLGIDEEILMPSMIHAAATLVSKHELRALDAIQLASAIFTRSRLKEQVRFISADRKLLEAAQKEGFEVWDPSA